MIFIAKSIFYKSSNSIHWQSFFFFFVLSVPLLLSCALTIFFNHLVKRFFSKCLDLLLDYALNILLSSSLDLYG